MPLVPLAMPKRVSTVLGMPMATVRQAVGAGERGASGAVDADNARETGRRGDLVDRLRQAVHRRSLGVAASTADGEQCVVAGQRGPVL